jgi:hypothetical protein
MFVGTLSIAGEAVRRTGTTAKEEHVAKYAFLFLDDGVEYQADPTPEQQRVYADIFKWFETNRSRFVDGGEELQPARTATTIRKSGSKIIVGDGPFIEAKEGIGGFSIIQAKDMADAVALAKTWPGYGLEIRPMNEEGM